MSTSDNLLLCYMLHLVPNHFATIGSTYGIQFSLQSVSSTL